MLGYSFKKAARVFIDAFLFSTALIIAYKLRLEHNISNDDESWFWNNQLPAVLSVVVFIKIAALFSFQTYRKMWRYTGLSEILDLRKPILISSLLLAMPRIIGLNAKSELFVIPLGVIFIDLIISFILLSSARLIRQWQISNRTFKQRILSKNKRGIKKALIIGAGIAAIELCKKIEQHPELEMQIVCALDDDFKKQGAVISGNISIAGKIDDLSVVIKKYGIEQIIIAIPSLKANRLREIVQLCQTVGIETKIIPGVDQLAGGTVEVDQIRRVSLEDLLGREPVDLSIPELTDFINNKIVLITGAGGSIGSEITRQIVKNFQPKEVLVLGRGENSIFNLLQELRRDGNLKVDIKPIICDIRNYRLLRNHLEKLKPDVVFHAAAHKHVPLMEAHPQEAFENNFLGTKNIAELSGIIGTKTFVNISTDKAVNPINILGYTKRLAELIVHSLASEYTNTKYISVRFGNVIGSRGSVLPIWESQLRNNLPITVTSKDAYRFFMTIPEAAQLVIKSGAIGHDGEIMVLDMGEEINIYDLAINFIKLSGFDPDAVGIDVIGLRAGEKLKEELVGYYEGTTHTTHKKIMVIKGNDVDINLLQTLIKRLSANIDANNEYFQSLLAKEVEDFHKLETRA